MKATTTTQYSQCDKESENYNPLRYIKLKNIEVTYY